MLPSNRIKQAVQQGRTAYGVYITQPAPGLVEVAAQAGLDFIRVDVSHAILNPETVASLFTAAYASGITPTVRVANDPVQIVSVLEQGAMGLTIPDVESVDQAQAVVQAARYTPRGAREMSRPLRTIAAPSRAYFDWADRELIVSVQIESLAGLEQLEQIVAVEGLDMVQSGRNDLAAALGVPGQANHPSVLEAEERIVEAAWKANKWVSLHFPPGPDSVERAREWARRGAQCITIGFDAPLLLGAMRDYRSAITSHLREASQGS